MDKLQEKYLKALTQDNNKLETYKEYIDKVKDVKESIDYNLINTHVSNLYIEYYVRKILLEYKINKPEEELLKIYVYAMIYHPKLYELIMNNKTIGEYDDLRKKLLESLEYIYTSKNKDKYTCNNWYKF